MPLPQIDKIIEIVPGKSISAIKCLTLSEEYLQDHFPKFPVMPGVLMLEALYQAASWLVLYSEDFQHTWTMLKEAKNVKYQGFVAPGDQLRVTATITKQEGNITRLKTTGTVDGEPAVNGILFLESQNFSEAESRMSTEWLTRRDLRIRFNLLYEDTGKPAGSGDAASKT